MITIQINKIFFFPDSIELEQFKFMTKDMVQMATEKTHNVNCMVIITIKDQIHF